MRIAVAISVLALLAGITTACGASGAGQGAAGTAVTRPAEPATSAGARPSPTATDPISTPGIGAVSRTEITLVDTSRPTVARPPTPASDQRVLRTVIRRPADGAGPWPLVIFGHGFAVDGDSYGALLDDVARAGFVVAAPEFPGSTSAAPGRPDERDLEQEPCDLRFVATHVQSQAGQPGALAGITTPGAVALAGQSDGATAAAFAALTPQTCPSPPIAAVVGFSANPVPAGSLDVTSLAPGAALLTVTGTADTVNPPSHSRALYEQWPGPAWLLTSDGDDHLGPSTTSARRPDITAATVAFLLATLGDRPTALTRLNATGARPGLHLESR